MMKLYSYDEALDIILTHQRPTATTSVAVAHAAGLVLAEDVISQIHIPPFDNSAMDGFALKAADVSSASENQPVSLNVLGVIAAGDAPIMEPLQSGACYQIMTGAAVPAGADVIIPVELSDLQGERVSFQAPYELGKHIRKVGTDFKKGDVLFKAGQKITAQMIPALCSVGLTTVKVYEKPSVVWLSTGEELTDHAGESLQPGKIFNTSGPYGEEVMPAFGADLKWRRTIPDDLDLFRQSLVQAAEQDIDVIISTGAVSVGMFDFVRNELEAAGWDILLHRARVKPGKPILFAKFSQEGKKDRFFFGLPGNPVSSAMGLRIFVSPFLRAMQTLPKEVPQAARLTDTARAAEGLTVFMKAVSHVSDGGQIQVTPLDAQQSYQVGAMGAMNCWLIHPEGQAQLDAGSTVFCLPFLPV